MYVYWRIQFGDGPYGWLRFNAEMTENVVLDDDGNEILDGIDYTTIDTEPTPPVWG